MNLRSIIKRPLRFVGLAFAATLLMSAAYPAAAFADTNAQQKQVYAVAGCGTYSPLSAYINAYGTNIHYGSIFLEYDSCTRNVWTYATDYVTCMVTDGCVTGYITRNSDGAQRVCQSDLYGATYTQETCSTGQLYDANVTSYSSGTVLDGPTNADGQTGSF